MANLVQLSNDLEFVPKEQLIQMSQDPNSTFPPYLVLAEIQRRTQMEKMYAAQQPQPQTTVAEELVGEFASSPAGLGAMAQSSDSINAFPSGEMGNMAPPSPMQMMARGGLTGYQDGRITRNQLDSTFNNPMEENINKEEVDKNFGQLAQQYGVSGLKAIGALNEDGSINYLNSALAIASINPAFRLAKGAVGLGGRFVNRFAPGLLQGAKNLVTKPVTATRKGNVPFMPEGAAAKLGFGPGKTEIGRKLRVPTVRGIGSLALPTLVVDRLIQSGMSSAEAEKEAARLKAEEDRETAKQLEESIATRQAEAEAKEEEAKNKALAEVKKSRQADMLIGLGGAIGSARNLSELSSGISDAYFGVKAAEQASEFKGLQGRLLEAQIKNIQADIAGMPLKELQSSAQIIQDGIESGALSSEEYSSTLKAIAERIILLQNLAATGIGDNPLDKNRIAAS